MRWTLVIFGILLSVAMLCGISSNAIADSPLSNHTTTSPSFGRLHPGQSGWTKLMEASLNGDIHVVKSLLNKGVDVNARARTEDTALALAVYKGHLDIVRLLLNNGANPNQPGRSNDTPLQEAARHGYPEIITLLLENGADANLIIQDSSLPNHTPFGSKQSALEMSVIDSNLTCFGRLIDHTDLDKYGGEVLEAAIARDNTLVVETLLIVGVSANTYINGRPIYTHAAEKNRVKILSLLLKHGANVKAKDTKGKGAAILIATRYYYTEIVRLLIEAGADVNTHTKERTTLLDMAKQKEHDDIVALLRKHNAYEPNPKIDAFLTSGIQKLNNIFNLGNDDNYLENMLGKAIKIDDLGEFPTYEVGYNRRKSKWVYNGAKFHIVTPDFYVTEIEVADTKYKLTNGLGIKNHKRAFIKILGPPFKETNNTIEYITRGGDNSYHFTRRAVLTTNERGYVLKINWFNNGEYISHH